MPQPRVVNLQLHPNEQIFYSDYNICLLAEGDSWFSWSYLNLVPSSNLLQQLDFDKPALAVSYAYAGDTIRRIADFFDNGGFFIEMRSQRYDAILLSGGGNDLIDALYDFNSNTPIVLQEPGASDPDDPNSYVNFQNLTKLTNYVKANFERIFDYRLQPPASNANTPIILHTYDYATPRIAPAEFMGMPARGPWLLPALVKVKAPANLHSTISKLIFDSLAEALLSLRDESEGIHVVDTRDTIRPADQNAGGESGDWINEIHPTAQGYASIAWKICQRLEQIGIT
jgi:lysophospholipase L1-like esterase